MTAPSHGGPAILELEALRLAVEDVLDFSVSTNPYGPAPEVAEAIRWAAIAAYPDPAATVARRKLAAHLGTDPERVVLGNGAADLLWVLARALVPAQSRVLMVEPTFSEFRRAAEATGATIVEWRARAEDDFAVDLAAVADRAVTADARVVYLCAPNVPTGAAIAVDAIADFARALPGRDIVLDQSFLLLSERFDELSRALPDNVTCVRSLTKEHGIPGVRVGYLLARESVAARIEAQRPAWSTSAPAQAAAIATCDVAAFVAESRTRLLSERARLTGAIRELGFTVVPSTTNFFLVRVGDAAAFRRRLLIDHRILVRDGTSFGLPSYVRMAARIHSDHDRLLSALHGMVASGSGWC
jgi:histidinol-phosphate/aromatic aminotransferase/cobyric acid decarboxylase-like protein